MSQPRKERFYDPKTDRRYDESGSAREWRRMEEEQARKETSLWRGSNGTKNSAVLCSRLGRRRAGPSPPQDHGVVMMSHSYEDLFQEPHTERQEHIPQDKLKLSQAWRMRGATSKMTHIGCWWLHFSVRTFFLGQQRRKTAHICNEYTLW